MDKFDRAAKKLGFRLFRDDDSSPKRWHFQALEADYVHLSGLGAVTKAEALNKLHQELAAFPSHQDAIDWYTRFND